MPTWVPFACMAIGTITVLRAVFIVAAKSTGRFGGDPVITWMVGFLLIYLGQCLHAR